MMDTSGKYIKMCEKAVEIQKYWELKEDDGHEFIYCLEDSCLIECGDEGYDFCQQLGCSEFNWIWLPRQDELQKMISPDFFKQHQFFSTYISQMLDWDVFLGQSRFGEYWELFQSWEQLWLAFVMKEKYNKIWNGEDWVKEG
jgi:hypothetical protein